MDNDISAVPAITEVTDHNGKLDNPGTTSDPNLTLSGTGTENSVLMLNDNGTPIGSISVINNGTWITQANGLAERSHSFTVRSTGEGESSPWLITVATVAAPTIILVRDSEGDVPDGGTTTKSEVTVVGGALAGETLQIFDGQTLLGTTIVQPNNLWGKELAGLSAGQHTLTAKGLGADRPASNAWVFTVQQAAAPTISSVKDFTGAEIPPDAETFSSSVTLSGTAAKGEQVQISDDGTPLGTVEAPNGSWVLPLTGLAVKRYVIKAKGLYGSKPISDPRAFTVKYLEVSENFDAIPETPIATGKTLELPSMTIRNVDIQRQGDVVVTHNIGGLPTVPGQMEKGVLMSRSEFELQVVHLEILPKVPCPRVRFYYTMNTLDNTVDVEFFNAAGARLGGQPLLKGHAVHPVDFSSAGGIARILFTYGLGDSLVTIDYVRFDA